MTQSTQPVHNRPWCSFHFSTVQGAFYFFPENYEKIVETSKLCVCYIRVKFNFRFSQRRSQLRRVSCELVQIKILRIASEIFLTHFFVIRITALLVIMTWPTKDDDSSSEDSPPTQNQLFSTNVTHGKEERPLELEQFDDEPEVCIPLRMILIPTEEELNLSQITPSSSYRNFSLHANHQSLRDRDDVEQPTTFESDFDADENRAQLNERQEQMPTGFETEKQSNAPEWATDEDFNYSLDMPPSLLSPPNSPEFQRKRLQPLS